jgi:hypothetical protein
MNVALLQALALASVAGIVFVTLSPVRYRPTTGHAWLDRGVAFCVGSALCGVAFQEHIYLVAAFVLGGACALEAAQAILPSRHARWADLLQKLLGALAGFGVAALIISSGILASAN